METTDKNMGTADKHANAADKNMGVSQNVDVAGKDVNAADEHASSFASPAKESSEKSAGATAVDFLDDLIDVSEGLAEVIHPLRGIANTLSKSVGNVGSGAGAESTGSADNPKASFADAAVSFQPRALSSKCSRCATKNEKACALCLEACPAHCIHINGAEILIDETRCLGCGLCFAVCPTEAFVSKETGPANLDDLQLYRSLIKRAISHEYAYVTCVHAAEQQGLSSTQTSAETGTATRQSFLSTESSMSAGATVNPYKNLLIVPCLAAITKEVWFAVLADFPNVGILLPPTICQCCPVNMNSTRAEETFPVAATAEETFGAATTAEETLEAATTAEETFGAAIATAEVWAGTPVGLRGNRDELNRAQKRELKRAHFLGKVTDVPDALFLGKAPKSLEARCDEIVEEYVARLDAFSKRAQLKMNLGVPHAPLPPDFNKTEAATRKRARAAQLTKNHLLLLATLFYHSHLHSHLASTIMLEKPERDATRCTLCGACEKACMTSAIQFTEENKWKLQKEACVRCDECMACQKVCPTSAIKFKATPAVEFLF